MHTPDARFFVDTNLLLYSSDSRNPFKQQRAIVWLTSLWESRAGRLSWQVLNEYYSNAQRKFGVRADEARKTVRLFAQWNPHPVNGSVVERGWYWMDEAKLSYWDSLILASAERLACGVLLSEDFQADRTYGTVRVVNPFQIGPEDFIQTVKPSSGRYQ
jgi:predicted nucleic acid-binding protein